MRKPIFIRPLTQDEQRQIQAGLQRMMPSCCDEALISAGVAVGAVFCTTTAWVGLGVWTVVGASSERVAIEIAAKDRQVHSSSQRARQARPS